MLNSSGLFATTAKHSAGTLRLMKNSTAHFYVKILSQAEIGSSLIHPHQNQTTQSILSRAWQANHTEPSFVTSSQLYLVCLLATHTHMQAALLPSYNLNFHTGAASLLCLLYWGNEVQQSGFDTGKARRATVHLLFHSCTWVVRTQVFHCNLNHIRQVLL